MQFTPYWFCGSVFLASLISVFSGCASLHVPGLIRMPEPFEDIHVNGESPEVKTIIWENEQIPVVHQKACTFNYEIFPRHFDLENETDRNTGSMEF